MGESERYLNNSPEFSEEEKNIDAREKSGLGLEFWAKSLLERGLISQEVYDDFVRKNNSKEQEMEKRGLPQLKHYGFFSSVEEIRETAASQENQHFIIRCASKENGEIRRLIDADINEACEFAEKLPGGFEKWKVELKEFVPTTMSGTIIVGPSGRTSIETWPGAHYLNVLNSPKYHAEFDPERFDTHFRWTAPEGGSDLPDLQQPAIKALSYFFPHLKPRPNEPIYAEYGVRPNGEVYFIEANDSPLLTEELAFSPNGMN